MRGSPPPILHFLLAFGAGLLTGLSHFVASLLVGMVLLLLTRGLPPRHFVVPVLAGILIGLLDAHHAASQCSRMWADGVRSVTVKVTSAGSNLGSGMPVQAGCHGGIALRWPNRRSVPQSGSLAIVTGEWRGFASGGGVLLVQHSGVVDSSHGGVSAREWVVAVIRELYGNQSPVVEAMLLGRRSNLDPTIREAFVGAGLVHLLAISGFHVGLLAGWAFLLLRAVGLARRFASLGAVGLTLAYAGALGWPVPATRAALMIGAVAWGQIRQRAIRPIGLWATTALLLLMWQPSALTEVGAWLSFAAVWGTTVGGRWMTRLGSRKQLPRMLASSVGATVATAPITAAVFGTVAPIGVLLNLIAIPLAATAIPGLMASLVLAPIWPFLAQRIATGAGVMLKGLVQVASLGAQIPLGQWYVEPGVLAALIPLVGLTGVWWITARGWATAGEARRRALWLGTAALWLPLLNGVIQQTGHTQGRLSLHFLDVGQGDAIVIETPKHRFILVDAGPRTERWDAGRRAVVPFLRRHGAGRLTGAILSHAHLDHLGGLATVLERVPTGWIMEPLVPVPDSNYVTLLDEVGERGIPLLPARQGEEWTLDGVRWHVLHPDTLRQSWGLDLNEDSAVLLIEYGRFRAVLTGDAGVGTEAYLAGTIGPVDLLKVGHHGSRGATGKAWLDELRPTVSVISLGRNRFGHPAPETINRLTAVGSMIWRTDQLGTISVTTDGAMMTVLGRGRRDVIPLPCLNTFEERIAC